MMNTKALCAAAALAIAPSVASAAVVNFDVTVALSVDAATDTNVSQYLGTTGSGFYEFTSPGAANADLFLADSEFSLTVDFATGSETFSGGQDIFGAPQLSLNAAGTEQNLFYTVADTDTFGGAYTDQIQAPDVVTISIADVLVDGNGQITNIDLKVSVVPVPAALPLMLAGLGAFAFAARRKA